MTTRSHPPTRRSCAGLCVDGEGVCVEERSALIYPENCGGSTVMHPSRLGWALLL